MNRRIPIAATVLAYLLFLNACQNPSRIAPVGPAPFGDLSVDLSAPRGVTGANLDSPDAQEAGYFALSGAQVSLVAVDGDLQTVLSAAPVAQAVSDARGNASFRGLKCGVDYRVIVNVAGGNCEKIEKKVRTEAGQTAHCKASVEKENKTAFSGDVDILEHPKVFSPSDTLHFDWEVLNPTGSAVAAEWRVVSANDQGAVLAGGTASVEAGSNLIQSGISLALTGFAPTNSAGQSSYKILCVVDGQVVGSDNFVVLRGETPASTPTSVPPTATPEPPTATFTHTDTPVPPIDTPTPVLPTDTPTPLQPICVQSGTDTLIFETGMNAVIIDPALYPVEWLHGCSGAPWVSNRADGRFSGQRYKFGHVVDLPAGNWRAVAEIMADDRYIFHLGGQASRACPDPWCYDRCTTFTYENIPGGPVTFAVEDIDTGGSYYGANYKVCFTPM